MIADLKLIFGNSTQRVEVPLQGTGPIYLIPRAMPGATMKPPTPGLKNELIIVFDDML